MKWLVLLATFVLTACGGTALEFDGPLCGGQPATLSLADKKDRAGFEARCTHTSYGANGQVIAVDEVVITSSESSTSEVMRAQAEALSNLATAIAQASP